VSLEVVMMIVGGVKSWVVLLMEEEKDVVT
jgi:hypothetical protein